MEGKPLVIAAHNAGGVIYCRVTRSARNYKVDSFFKKFDKGCYAYLTYYFSAVFDVFTGKGKFIAEVFNFARFQLFYYVVGGYVLVYSAELEVKFFFFSNLADYIFKPFYVRRTAGTSRSSYDKRGFVLN